MDGYIRNTDETFQFDKITLNQPNGMTAGSYLTRIQYMKEPLYIQTPKTQSKAGVVVAGKKGYIDLVLTNEDSEFIDWLTSLEETVIERLYDKRNLWFNTELEKSDIENTFSSPIRAYKGGKQYIVRINLEPAKMITSASLNTNNPFSCKIFDENEAAAAIEYIQPEHKIISIIEIQGIKFTSRSFQFEMILRQTLVLADEKIFDECLIKKPHSKPVINTNTNTNTNTNINTKIQEPNNENKNNEFNLGLAITKESEDSSLRTNTHSESTNIPSENTSTPSENTEENTENISKDTKPKDDDHDDVIITLTPGPDGLMEVDLQLDGPSDKPAGANIIKMEFEDEDDNDEEQEQEDTDEDITKMIENISDTAPPLKLKRPNEVYYELYKIAKEKAKEAKKKAIQAYLEAQNIKATYMLDDLEEDDDSEEDDEEISKDVLRNFKL